MNRKNKDFLKTGQTFYPSANQKSSIDNKNIKVDEDIRKGKYPNGIVPFIFITLVFVVISLIGNFAVDLITWKDAFAISSGISFCLCLVWFVLRQRFNLSTRYNLKKMSIHFKLNRLKITEPYKNWDYSINRVSSIDEYNEYLIERSKRTKVFFLITISLYTCLFIIFIIISATL
ncbi:MAG: hypothetical protein K2O21_02130 [Malacoplasma sp.]|nr:hypothetical protein [Malacoplasma sp.]